MAVDIVVVPALEYDELPQAQRVVAAAGEMLVEKAPHERRLKIVGGRRRALQRVGEQITEFAAEPDTKRHAEALLGSIEEIARKQARSHLFQYVLAASVFDFERRRKRCCKRDHLVVEQRYARLDRVRHAYAVDFCEHVFGQIRLRIEALHLRRAGEVSVEMEMAGGSVVLVERCQV